MSGYKNLYITESCQIYPLTQHIKPVPELAHQSVFLVMICYETLNRKPFLFNNLYFWQEHLDEHGEVIQNELKEQHMLRVALAAMNPFPQSKEPIPLPLPLELPSDGQLDALDDYLETNYPELWEENPDIIELAVAHAIQNHHELIQEIKKLNKSK